MATKTFYPHTITQTTGGNFVTFDNLNNLKNSSATYATTGTIGKNTATSNTPSNIIATNFKVSLPTGAEIQRIRVEVAHKQSSKLSVPKPTVTLVNTTGGESGQMTAPTTTMTERTKTFYYDQTLINQWLEKNFSKIMKANKLTKAQMDKFMKKYLAGKANKKVTGIPVKYGINQARIVGNTNFGVKIAYPPNASKKYTGTVTLKYIRINVRYKIPSYALTASETVASSHYLNNQLIVELSITNKNLTKYNPTIMITIPTSVEYLSASGDGTVTVGSSVRLNWNPKLTSSKSKSTIQLRFTNTTIAASQVITVVENLYSTTKNVNFSITAAPSTTGISTGDEDIPYVNDENATPTNTEVVYVNVNEEFSLDLTFTDYDNDIVLLYACVINNEAYGGDFNDFSPTVCTESIYGYIYSSNVWHWTKVTILDGEYISPLEYSLWRYGLNNNFKCTTPGEYVIAIYDYNDSTNLLKQINVCVMPTTLTMPPLALLQLSEEELDRLGNNVSYTAQSFLKEISSEGYVRNWNKNFRIGVFNNRIEDNLINICSWGTFNEDTVTATINTNIPYSSINVVNEESITYSISDNVITFTKDEEGLVNVDIQLLDSDSEIIGTGIYQIDFDNSEIITDNNKYDPTDYSTLTLSQIFNNAEYWSDALSEVNTWENKEVNFPYDENYPVHLLITGDFPEGNPATNDIVYTSPAIIENEGYTGYEETGNFPEPINATISSELGDAFLNMAGINQSNTIIFNELPLSEDFGTDGNIAIRGIEVNATVNYTDDLILTGKIHVKHDNEELTGTRSMLLSPDDDDTTEENEMTTEISLGGEYDTWGIPIGSLTNLEDMEIDFIFNNSHSTATEDTTNILFSNVNVTVYADQVEQTMYTAYVEGEDVRYYGMFIQDIKIPFGLDTNVKYLNVEGTDLNDPINQTLANKTIEIEFDLGDCDLLESTNQIMELAQLFTNERDNMNTPIPKKIVFSHMPGYYAEYILEDSFDDEVDITTYTGKIKLIVPAGTFYALNDTVTAGVGMVNSITKVKPVLDITPSTSTLEIEETVSGQKFTITYDDWQDRLLRIDCEDRKAWLLTNEDDDNPTDISSSVDWNSDWFMLQGEYNFSTSGCVLNSVTYTERN